jgi:hypothetical protein
MNRVTYAIVVLQKVQVLELVLTKGCNDIRVLNDVQDLACLSLSSLQLLQDLLALLGEFNGY